MSSTEAKTPIHQWTRKDGRILIVKCVDAEAQLADTPENGHVQAATYGQARGAMYSSLIAVISSDRVNAC